MSKKQQLLDPISSMCKLILLNFYPAGSRIYVKNNRIHIDPPHKGQFLERFANGDSRSDICILGGVIDRFINQYLIPAQDNEPDTYDQLLRLAEYACQGMYRLQITYFESNSRIYDNCIYALQYMIDRLYNQIHNLEFTSRYGVRSLHPPENLLDDDKLRHLWNNNDIDQIYRSFTKCFDGSTPLDREQTEVAKNLVVIETYLKRSDELFSDLVASTNNG